MIYTTVYVSTLHESLSAIEMGELLEVSRFNNARREISGMLVVRGRRVMQLLEGEETEVRGLFGKIVTDPRHDDVVNVWASTHETRRFPEWTMGFDNLDIPAEITRAGWPEPDLADVFEPSIPRHLGAEGDYVRRRADALRRALVSGAPLVTSLAIILHGHRPEVVLSDHGQVALRCAECRPLTSPGLDSYPCSTARNAIGALESI